MIPVCNSDCPGVCIVMGWAWLSCAQLGWEGDIWITDGSTLGHLPDRASPVLQASLVRLGISKQLKGFGCQKGCQEACARKANQSVLEIASWQSLPRERGLGRWRGSPSSLFQHQLPFSPCQAGITLPWVSVTSVALCQNKPGVIAWML